MKNIFFILGCIILSMGSLDNIGAESAKDFQKFSWGDNLKLIKQNEKSVLIDETNQDMGVRLRYKYNYAGYNCMLIYFFDNENKLYRGSYLFENSVKSPAMYKVMVKKFSDLLKKTYGKPADNNSEGTSVLLDWKTKRVVITLSYYTVDKDGYLNLASIDYEVPEK